MSTKHHGQPKESGEAKASEKTEVYPAEVGEAIPEQATTPAGPAVVEGQAEELKALRERVAALEERERALTEESSSLKDQYLRKLADYENFRKRMFRERDDSLKYANSGLLSDLVAILDDFDRAIGSAGHAQQDYKTLSEGVGLIRRQFGQMLATKYGLISFEPLGEPFDPNFHEALASEVGEVDEETVCQVFLPGYKLQDRVLRSAKVKVRLPSPNATPSGKRNPQDSTTSGEKPMATDDGGPETKPSTEADQRDPKTGGSSGA